MKGLKKFKEIEQGVFETPDTIDTFGQKVGLHSGEASEMSTQSAQPLVDSGTGSVFPVRCFRFKLPPVLPQGFKWDKQAAMNEKANFIRTFLWKDGLIAIEEIPPRIFFKKKEKEILIFITCQPRLGETLLDRPTTLQEVFKPRV